MAVLPPGSKVRGSCKTMFFPHNNGYKSFFIFSPRITINSFKFLNFPFAILKPTTKFFCLWFTSLPVTAAKKNLSASVQEVDALKGASKSPECSRFSPSSLLLACIIVSVCYYLPNTLGGGGGGGGGGGAPSTRKRTPEKVVAESKEYHTVMKFADLQPLGEVFTLTPTGNCLERLAPDSYPVAFRRPRVVAEDIGKDNPL